VAGAAPPPPPIVPPDDAKPVVDGNDGRVSNGVCIQGNQSQLHRLAAGQLALQPLPPGLNLSVSDQSQGGGVCGKLSQKELRHISCEIQQMLDSRARAGFVATGLVSYGHGCVSKAEQKLLRATHNPCSN
jgi:hypothetical protein